MHQTLSKKIRTCFVCFILLITCTACKASSSYKICDYINDLAIISGIGNSVDTNDNFIKLRNWGILDNNVLNKFNEPVNYYFLCESISRLIEEENDYLIVIKNLGWIDINIDGNSFVSKQEAQRIIESAIEYKNNIRIKSVYDFEYKNSVKEITDELEEGDVVFANGYKVIDSIDEGVITYKDADIDDVYEKLEIADSFEIDFDKAEIIPYGDCEVTNYVNSDYNLLASNSNHVYYTDGFRISYSFNSSGIRIHVSKNVNKINLYANFTINKIKPTFKWAYEKGDIKNCFMKVDFDTTEHIGASIGKYGRYYLDFKDLDSSSFDSLLKSAVKKEDDEVEATIKVCEIKTPIPNVPTAYFNIDVLIKLYVSGRVELACYNSHELGFEMKNGVFRPISNNTHDIDAVVGASGKAALGLNFNLEAVNFRLMDIELDGGIRSEIKTTMHLYDEDGNENVEQSDLAYDTVNTIAQENENVKVCADISLHWLFDILFNTPSTKMFKMGFTKRLSILDNDDQVFGNLHHIEDGMFVEKCTRKAKKKLTTGHSLEPIASNKIVLESYAEVLNRNESYTITVLSLPNGYKNSDLVFVSEDASVADVNGHTVYANTPGVTKVLVSTNDDKYEAYINILVRSE